MTVKNRPHVIAGFAEALAAPEAVWSLVDAGFDVTTFTRRGSRPPLRWSKLVTVVEVSAPEVDADQAMSDLAHLYREHQAVIMLPLDDQSLWLADQASAKHGITVAGVCGDAARIAFDKRLQISAAEQAGLRVPATVLVETAEQALANEKYPVVFKPALAVRRIGDGIGRGSGHICADRSELEAAVAAWNGVEPMMLQPFIRGCGMGVFGIVTDAGVSNWSGHRRLRMMNPAGSGSSACTSAPVDEQLAATIERMLMDIGWRGIFMIELLRDADGCWWFMELNGRTWGSTALARRCGFEFPAWQVQYFLKMTERFQRRDTGSNGSLTCRHLGREIVHTAFALRGPKSAALRATWPTRLGALASLCRWRRNECVYNYRPGDRRVFLRDVLSTVSSQLFGARGR